MSNNKLTVTAALMIAQAKEVRVGVTTKDDVYYVKVAKTEARQLLADTAGLALEAVGDILYIG